MLQGMVESLKTTVSTATQSVMHGLSVAAQQLPSGEAVKSTMSTATQTVVSGLSQAAVGAAKLAGVPEPEKKSAAEISKEMLPSGETVKSGLTTGTQAVMRGLTVAAQALAKAAGVPEAEKKPAGEALRESLPSQEQAKQAAVQAGQRLSSMTRGATAPTQPLAPSQPEATLMKTDAAPETPGPHLTDEQRAATEEKPYQRVTLPSGGSGIGQ